MKKSWVLVVLAVILGSGYAQAFRFELGDNITGSLDTQASIGFGMRLGDPDPALVGDPNYSAKANTNEFSNGDDGNLNYRKGDLFAGYFKLTPELLVNFPSDIKVMARGTVLLDGVVDDTARTDLDSDAKDQVARDFRLLDLWISKSFTLGNQTARVKIGNQFINWGEGFFAVGGINATTALDLQKLMTPGTQLKEAFLPSPMVSFSTGLGHGVNVEAYYQFGWDKYLFPPAGTYWSLGDIYDEGRVPFLFFNPDNFNLGGIDDLNGYTAPFPMLKDNEAKNSGQYGVAVHFKPQGTELDLGFYFINFHEKLPVLNYQVNGAQWQFPEDHQLYGVSANFPVGNWAVGIEASYRPDDPVALTAGATQVLNGKSLDLNADYVYWENVPGWIEEDKYQFNVAGLLALTPGDHGWFLDLVKADGGFIVAEVTDIYYPDLKDIYKTNINGTDVYQGLMAGYYTWLDYSDPAYPITRSKGTKNSLGYVLDVSLVYDGTVIPGWQVIPGVTFSHSVTGETPTFLANYLQDAMATNLYMLFNQNSGTWQAGLNYVNYFGGKTDTHQPWGDRDFIGGFLTCNF